jgi:hypothetical protein
MILPWPPGVEIRIREAELKALSEHTDDAQKYYVGRELVPLFEEAGLKVENKRTFSRDRTGPLDKNTWIFVKGYLKRTRDLVAPYLDKETKELCDPYLNPSSGLFILKNPAFSMTIVDHVIWGKPI